MPLSICKAKRLTRRAVTALSVLAAMLSLCACGDRREAAAEFFAMDTHMRIAAYGGGAKAAVSEARDEILALEKRWSVTATESEVYAYNSGGGLLSAETDMLLADALSVGDMTGGAFDVYIFPVVEAWGFFSHEYRVPAEDELEKLLLQRDKLDFGGIAKGYASGEAADIMRRHGVESALIVLGGNIYAVGNKPDGKPWSIAVQDPFDMSAFSGTLGLTDKAAVTSGAYQRYFEQGGGTYHHIIDPRSGYPADSGLASVTVVSADGAMADGLSTGLFVLGKERALEVWRENGDLFELVLIEDGGAITITSGLEGSFESEHGFEVAK